MSHTDISEAISKYASADQTLEHLQDTTRWIPKGDQKTGSIGEYYAFVYLLTKYDEKLIEYGRHSEKGWDIRITGDVGKKIQVKTVSGFSKTRTISPIHKGWDSLYLIYVSQRLEPEGFWIFEDQSIFGDEDTLNSKKCRDPARPNTGSTCFSFGENLALDLQNALSSVRASSTA